MKSIKYLICLLLIAGAAYYVKGLLYPSDTDLILKDLRQLEQLVTFSEQDSTIYRAARVPSIVSHFTQDIKIRVDGAATIVNGREEFREKLQGVVGLTRGKLFDLRLQGAEIKLGANNESAEVVLGAVVDLENERPFVAQEWMMTMRKVDGDWKIAAVETIKVISR